MEHAPSQPAAALHQQQYHPVDMSRHHNWQPIAPTKQQQSSAPTRSQSQVPLISPGQQQQGLAAHMGYHIHPTRPVQQQSGSTMMMYHNLTRPVPNNHQAFGAVMRAGNITGSGDGPVAVAPARPAWDCHTHASMARAYPAFVQPAPLHRNQSTVASDYPTGAQVPLTNGASNKAADGSTTTPSTLLGPTQTRSTLLTLGVTPSNDPAPADTATTNANLVHANSGQQRSQSSTSRWTTRDLLRARQLRAEGCSNADIGRVSNKTASAVTAKLWRDSGKDPHASNKQHGRYGRRNES